MHVTTVSEWITQTRETQILMASEMHAMTTWMEMVKSKVLNVWLKQKICLRRCQKFPFLESAFIDCQG